MTVSSFEAFQRPGVISKDYASGHFLVEICRSGIPFLNLLAEQTFKNVFLIRDHYRSQPVYTVDSAIFFKSGMEYVNRWSLASVEIR